MSEQREVVRAAGGILVRDDGAGARYAIIHRPRYDDWTFPKGKLLDGELEETAALREVAEETGLRCRLDADLGTVTYTDRAGRRKTVRYWAMTPEHGDFVANAEVDALRWVAMDEALRSLTYAHDRDLLRAVRLPPIAAPVYVVRHAKAGNRERWEGPDLERPLTRRGRRQADRLVELFRGLDAGGVISSPFLRCIQTVTPLADARGLVVQRAAELAEGADVEAAAAFVLALDPQPVVLCGHGTEIGDLIGRFAEGGATVQESRGIAKGSVWVLERREGRVVSARYLPAPAG